jgi:hypothetical protein
LSSPRPRRAHPGADSSCIDRIRHLVGFPGETDSDFGCLADYLNNHATSPRVLLGSPGTPAAALSQVHGSPSVNARTASDRFRRSCRRDSGSRRLGRFPAR